MKNRIFSILIVLSFLPFCTVAQWMSGLKSGYPQSGPTLTTEDCEQLFEVVNDFPTGLATDGVYFWGFGTANPYLYRYELSGFLLDSLELGIGLTAGGGLHYADGFLWLVLEQQGALFKIDPATGAVQDTFFLPGYTDVDPNNFGITSDDDFFWHTRYRDNLDSSLVFKLDKSTFALLDSFYIQDPGLLGLTSAGGYLFAVSIYDDVLHQIDPTTGMIINTTDICASWVIDVCAIGNQIYLLSGQVGPGGSRSVYGVDGVVLTTQTEPDHAQPIKLFPNPAQSSLTITHTSTDVIRSYSIFNLQGQLLRHAKVSGNVIEVEIRQLTTGMYSLLVELESGRRITERFVVE